MQFQWCRSSFFTFNFEHISHIILVFPFEQVIVTGVIVTYDVYLFYLFTRWNQRNGRVESNKINETYHNTKIFI